jgi:hypothetical protein
MTAAMTLRTGLTISLVAAGLGMAAAPRAEPLVPAGAGRMPGVVSHISVVSDKVEDVSSMEAWKRSFIKPGMTDEQKALAVWETVVKFRQQDSPPNEYLQDETNVHDPIKTFNVYGYGMCCCAASNIEALARYAGLQARGRIISAHSVPEVFWDGGWHLLDASLINYMPKADGKLASVDEIIAGIKEFYALHPDLKRNDPALRAFMRGGGWKKGPAILANSPFYDQNGWLPAATHGWYTTMQEYDGSENGITEYGYSQGYQVNVQLRPGERLVRSWSNKGLHVNQLEGGEQGSLTTPVGQGDLRYAPKYGDLAPGRIGNGTLEYQVPLADPIFRRGALAAENLASRGEDGKSPALHLKQSAAPGVLTIRMPSSYVYLSGAVDLNAVVAPGGAIDVALSDNNGLDWKPVATVTASGPRHLDLKPLVYRRYDYRVRFTLKGAGTGLDALKLSHDIQHSQRALPALGQGSNTITFKSGPQEGTVTVEGSLNSEAKGKQLVFTDFHPKIEGLGAKLSPASGQGSVTFPISTPGDITRLRLGGYYRARDAKDAWQIEASFDGGKTFRAVDRFEGPTVGVCKYVTFSDIPAGSREALVRWTATQRNTTCLFDLRIDADYEEPHGGFRPVKATYVWDEDGVEKRDVHVALRAEETYPITCAVRPTMKSLIVELAR